MPTPPTFTLETKHGPLLFRRSMEKYDEGQWLAFPFAKDLRTKDKERLGAVFHESVFQDKSTGEIVIDHEPLRTFIEFITARWRVIERKSFAPIASLCVECFGEEHRPKSLQLLELKFMGIGAPVSRPGTILLTAWFSDQEGLSEYGAYHFETSFVIRPSKDGPWIRIWNVSIDGVS